MNKNIHILLFLTGVVSLFLPACFAQEKANVSPPTLENFQVLSIKELYPEARDAAIEWRKDAYLDGADLTASLYRDTNILLDVSYYFRSDAEPESYYTYSIFIRSQGRQNRQSEGTFNLPTPPGIKIIPEQLAFDSKEALNIMYDALGREFFGNCKTPSVWPSSTSISLEQREFQEGKEKLIWSASFSCDKPESMSAIFIDAYTGEVIEIRR